MFKHGNFSYLKKGTKVRGVKDGVIETLSKDYKYGQLDTENHGYLIIPIRNSNKLIRKYEVTIVN